MFDNRKAVADFPDEKRASNVIIRIPVPLNAANAKITVGRGRAKYEPGERALVWRISSFPGATESLMTAVVELLPQTREKAWIRTPITMDFSIRMYSCSGVQVRFLKVYEKSGYQTGRWVQYVSKSGHYAMNI